MSLKSIRLDNKLSQNELSKRAGVNLRMIQYYEQGKKDINSARVSTLYKLSKTLNCKIEELLDEERL